MWLRSPLIRKTDATYDQSKVYQWYQRYKGRYLCSVDLTAATDRLPLTLQVLILSLVLGNPWLAIKWGLIMGLSRFAFQRTRGGKIDFITYGTGQAMGFYSS